MNESGKAKGLKPKHIVIIATIGIAPLLANLDGSIVMIASPALAEVFRTDATGVSMIIVAYLLIAAAFALIFGRLGDIIGPGKIFMTGFAVITVGSFLCGIAPSLNSLIAFRVVQSLGSTMLFATFYAVIATSLPEEIRGRAIGFTGVLGSIGFAIGAPVGGFLLKYLSWHWLFLFNIPFGIAGLFFSYKFLPRDHSPSQARIPFDMWGALLSLVFLVALVYALNYGQINGWGTSLTLLLFGVSLVGFFLFIVRERTFASPLVDLTFFKNKFLSFAVVAVFLVVILMDGILFLFPYFLELVRKISTAKAGIILMVLPAAIFVFSPIAGYLSDKKSPRVITSAAMIFILISTIFFAFLNVHTPIWYVLFSFALFGIAFAFFMVSNVTLIMSHSDAGNQGVLSAVIAVINSVGALMGVSFFQIIFSMRLVGNVKEISSTPPLELMGCFHRAMLFAIICCVPALIASIIAKEKRKA